MKLNPKIGPEVPGKNVPVGLAEWIERPLLMLQVRGSNHTKGLVGPMLCGKTITMLYSLYLCFEKIASIFDTKQATSTRLFNIQFSYYCISVGSHIQKQSSKECKSSFQTVVLPILFLGCTKNINNTKVNREYGISAVISRQYIIITRKSYCGINVKLMEICGK